MAFSLAEFSEDRLLSSILLLNESLMMALCAGFTISKLFHHAFGLMFLTKDIIFYCCFNH